ncbi:MAG: SigB/SigF/SigG family RNA polymerase sigma factor [Lachnospiraceae bacterium]|jgi:RNA polymerase sporulation-specific sigma factor|nr:SigB/SigF/SigG family RNA polymerase sigma factor [Lachnospiraceae bacterium]
MDETMNLIQMAHEGDKAARDRLVVENMGLIWSIVRRFDRRGYEMEDLFQIGSIGLMKAVDHFDLSLGLKFSTYAVPMITGEIKRFLRDDGMIKVSRSLKELGIRVNGARQELNGKLGRDPTIDEIAQCLGESREQIAASIESAAEIESLYRSVNYNDEPGVYLIDRIPEESETQEKLLNKMVLKKLVSELKGRDRDIILRRYFYNQTQSQVAKELHISQVQVSRLEKKILKSMREKIV